MKKVIDLGKIGITLAGEYNDKTIYEKLTIVLYKGKSYISTKTIQGVSPEQDTLIWQLVAEAKDAYHMLVDAGKTTLTEEEFLKQLEDATKGRYIVQGNIINAADEEDLTIEHSDILGIDTLKLANRPNTDGMGYVILRKNKSFAEQVTKENTIYEIRYDFNLNNTNVTIPDNCVLKFIGGSLSKIVKLKFGNNCKVIGNNCKWEVIGNNAIYLGHSNEIKDLTLIVKCLLESNNTVFSIDEEYIYSNIPVGSWDNSARMGIRMSNITISIDRSYHSYENINDGAILSIQGAKVTDKGKGMFDISVNDCVFDGPVNKAICIESNNSWITQLTFNGNFINKCTNGFYIRGSKEGTTVHRVNIINTHMQYNGQRKYTKYFLDIDWAERFNLYGCEQWDWSGPAFKITSNCTGVYIDNITTPKNYLFVNTLDNYENILYNPEVKINYINAYRQNLSDCLPITSIIKGYTNFTLNQLCSVPDGDYLVKEDKDYGNKIGVSSPTGGVLSVKHIHSWINKTYTIGGIATELTYTSGQYRKKDNNTILVGIYPQVKKLYLEAFLTKGNDREVSTRDWINLANIDTYSSLSDMSAQPFTPEHMGYLSSDRSLIIGSSQDFAKFPSLFTMRKGDILTYLPLLEEKTKYTFNQLKNLEEGVYRVPYNEEFAFRFGRPRNNSEIGTQGYNGTALVANGGTLQVVKSDKGVVLTYVSSSSQYPIQTATLCVDSNTTDREVRLSDWNISPMCAKLSTEPPTLTSNAVAMYMYNHILYFGENKSYELIPTIKIVTETPDWDNGYPGYLEYRAGTCIINTVTHIPCWSVATGPSNRRFVRADGAEVGTKTYGTFAEKPTYDRIYIGYRFFCTDERIVTNKDNSTEQLSNFPIFYKGQNGETSIWVDSLGRIVS